jgi:hypothetical protein
MRARPSKNARMRKMRQADDAAAAVSRRIRADAEHDD